MFLQYFGNEFARQYMTNNERENELISCGYLRNLVKVFMVGRLNCDNMDCNLSNWLRDITLSNKS